MYPPGGPRQPEMDFDQILNRLKEGFGQLKRRFGGGGMGLLLFGGIAIIILIWLASGMDLQLRGSVRNRPAGQFRDPPESLVCEGIPDTIRERLRTRSVARSLLGSTDLGFYVL